jgi:hypothetical protein
LRPKEGFFKAEDHQTCPVSALLAYVERFALKRPANCDALFVTVSTPHVPASPDTIGRWVSDYMVSLGITGYTAHSTRAASSSSAFARGVPIEKILASANWSSAETFQRFYLRQPSSSSSLSTSVG